MDRNAHADRRPSSTAMLKRLRLILQLFLSSFWFVPALMALAAVALYALTVTVDTVFDLQLRELERPGLPFAIGADGARQLMATIAGSLITVASLVFSMTLVALTVAAGNIGARLMMRYMRNKTIQITLGLFLAGFIYALLTLSAIGGEAAEVPRLSVVTAMLLAIGSFLWLVFAFHDLARTIQVDRSLRELAVSLREAIGSLRESGAQADRYEHPRMGRMVAIRAGKGGYVQSVNKSELLAGARHFRVSIDVRVRPGMLVMEGEPIADVHIFPESAEANERLERTVRRAILLGGMRSDLDDPFFCLRLINEIALRALSPGVNDFYTAVACIDHLAEGIRHLLGVGLPGNVLCNEKGAPVVWLAPFTLDDFLDSAFDPVRRAAAPHPALMTQLIDRLARLVALTDDPAIREALMSRMRNIAGEAEGKDYSPADRRLVEQAHDAARAGAEKVMPQVE